MDIPLGLMACVTGVSGSGKSTLINDTLYPVSAARLNGAKTEPAPHLAIEGLEHFDKVVDIDQSPIGRTPRSNPATYTGLFTPIRELFAATPEARSRGYRPRALQLQRQGRALRGLPGRRRDQGRDALPAGHLRALRRVQGQALQPGDPGDPLQGTNIHEVLEMTVEEAKGFFHAVPPLRRKLETLVDVGLSYIRLGQNATTLSGGEAQRVKLSRELSKRDTGKTLYILDEPTTGLHFDDVRHLLEVLHRLRDHGNTVVVIEHNLDVIKTADWVIDLGPEGGDRGGEIVAEGTPEQLAECPGSHTGRYLRALLERAAAAAGAVAANSG